MADPITAIGLVAAILQFIEIGARVASRMSDFSNSVDDIPKTFRHIKINLPLIVDSLRRIKAQAELQGLDKATQDALTGVVDECHREVCSLNDILDRAIPPAGASSWERRRLAIASFAKDKKVKAIEKALETYVRTLTLHQSVQSAGPVVHLAVQPSKPKIHFLLPFDRNSTFVGRVGIFKEIEQKFAVKEGSQPKAALCGLGGIGYVLIVQRI
jgi:N-terminal domain on NACHT_NTPase and P-loop NTPases